MPCSLCGIPQRWYVLLHRLSIADEGLLQLYTLCLQVRNKDISLNLLLVSAELLQMWQNHQPEPQQTLSPTASQLQAALLAFAHGILAKRIKYMQQQLSSTVRHKSNASLYLLASIAAMGQAFAANLVKNLDLTLPAFLKLAHPPK